MSLALLKPLLLLTLLALSGCAAVLMKPRVGVSDYCRIAKPITYNSKLDSMKTVAQVETHNSVWVCVCQGDCPKGGK
jgi:hypothetical protein